MGNEQETKSAPDDPTAFYPPTVPTERRDGAFEPMANGSAPAELRSYVLQEQDRQLILLAIATLANRRPGLNAAAERVASLLLGQATFRELKELQGDLIAKTEKSGLPSAADLDAIARETKAAEDTSGDLDLSSRRGDGPGTEGADRRR